jgi:hypothetical protein
MVKIVFGLGGYLGRKHDGPLSNLPTLIHLSRKPTLQAFCNKWSAYAYTFPRSLDLFEPHFGHDFPQLVQNDFPQSLHFKTGK